MRKLIFDIVTVLIVIAGMFTAGYYMGLKAGIEKTMIFKTYGGFDNATQAIENLTR